MSRTPGQVAYSGVSAWRVRWALSLWSDQVDATVTGWLSQVANSPEVTPTPDAPAYQPPTVVPARIAAGPAGGDVVRRVVGAGLRLGAPEAAGEREPDGEVPGDGDVLRDGVPESEGDADGVGGRGATSPVGPSAARS